MIKKVYRKIVGWFNAEDIHSEMGFGVAVAIFRHSLLIVLIIVLFCMFIKLLLGL